MFALVEYLPILFKWIGLLACLGLAKWFITSKKSSKNPFETDCTREPAPINKDKNATNKLIKQQFTPELVPGNLDAIVIGSGIGGLSAAAILSKAGKKVLILEQLKKAGGCTHTFKEKGVEFDVGIHYIGEKSSQTLSKTFIDQITEGQLQWADMEDAFDVVVIGEPPNERHYKIHSGPKKVENLKKYFPNDTEAIDQFFVTVGKVSNKMISYVILTRLFPRFVTKVLNKLGFYNLFGWDMFHKITLEQYLCKLTDNQELRDVLAYCFGDYGTMPNKASIGFHAILWKHFYHGAAYPVGGASEIAKTIIPVIEKSGGKVLTGASVSQIICKDGRAIGVTVDSKKHPEVKIYAPAIISDAGVRNTFNKLLPMEVAKNTELLDIISKLPHGKGGFSVFIGLEGSNKELELKSQNIWALSQNNIDATTQKYFNTSDSEVLDTTVPITFISFPSAKDPTWDTRYPDKSTMALVTLANYDWFEKWKNNRVKKRGDDYNAFKHAVAENMLERCIKLYPQIKNKIGDVCVGSPLSHDHYIASPRGEIYGLDHSIERFSPEVMSALRPETEVPGLYITGQDAMACGFSGAVKGGILCASSVLGRIIMKDLVKLHMQIKKKAKTV